MKKLFALLLCLCMVFSFMSFAAAEEKVNLTAIQYALENQQTDSTTCGSSSRLKKRPACMSISRSSRMPTGKPRPT